ncbi:DNA repair protein RecN (Recombination protein N) [Oceanospirillum multiglobuliferum]|uniref:DNA repair protein RecN n=1 Tax=Oceanospirillum multiglobuliferum TaxID=64969 RepID=A0A1T4RGX6_9GAMM|nr:DNA repair protein RecN [Oceanospirillum multiglobuliferum]OPX54878.1 DNA repair protein RecN [Oceanospirillum multiglobuliferum]SKA14988.1 DNA repair protein RecN (Recombination protein N) [Oceanospirillum multiglobuliferum]
MLTYLAIRNLAIVEALELDLPSGMTVITGETGAGKSILLDALGLALGDRADADSVRHGAAKAEILAQFDISQLPQAQHWLLENELEEGEHKPNQTASTQECQLRRVIHNNGRSKAWINGQPCSVQLLKKLGSHLIDIHGQHEHQSLLQRESHLRLLDAFAHLEPQVQDQQALFKNWQHCRRQLETLKNQDDKQQARIELLRYQVEELEQLALEEQELQSLEEEQQHLANVDTLILEGQAAFNLCDSDEGGARQLLNQACNRINHLPSQDARLNDIRQMLGDALIQIEEASRELEHFVSSCELDPERLQFVEERLSTIYQLARKHHITPEELYQHSLKLRAELNSIENGSQNIEQLAEQLQQLTEAFRQQAAQLSQQRKTAAYQLNQNINEQLSLLGMSNARFEVSIQNSEQFQAHGLDNVEFLISTNPGQPPKPMIKIASGGELSRISLAIQVVTAQTSAIPTLVFDEVDVGISGGTAEIVGQLLHNLAQKGQILSVTHLPQVAAQGDQHLFIKKSSTENSTHSEMVWLEQEQRVTELARMLGGIDLTEQTLAHAHEMLQHSQQRLTC